MDKYYQLTISLQKIRRAEERLNVLLQNKCSLEYDLKEKKEKLEAEEYDVEKLEGLSIQGFLHLIKGTLLDQLDKEEREAMIAKKAYDDTQEALSQCLKKIDEARFTLKDKLDIKRAHEACGKELEKDLLHSSVELRKIVEDQAYAKEVLREIREAEEAGQVLCKKLDGLDEQVKKLKSDVGIDESGLFKHDNESALVQDVNKTLLYIQEDIHRFELELMDVFNVCDLTCDLNFLKVFSNFLLRGMVERASVSNKLESFIKNMALIISEMKDIMSTLSDQKESIALYIDKLKKEKQSCIQKILEDSHEEDS